MIKPSSIRLEASTACQLRCPSCPTTTGQIGASIGTGFLTFERFKALVDANPWVKDVELSNWGEIFLNPHLVRIMAYAHRKRVGLRADNGVNFNTVPDEVLQALVTYRFQSLVCSIDGASQATYAVYRRRGDFDRVIANVRRLNALKSQHRSERPALTWQFVAFGHNEHEIPAARRLAQELGMRFVVKLSWDDMYTPETFSPVRDREAIRRETGLGVADRREYHARHGDNYLQRQTCSQLWLLPQINWDGRVLGCCVNYWGDFGNAFTDGLLESLNGEKLAYARRMLTGVTPAREDIPCTSCIHYKAMSRDGRWLTRADVERRRPPMLETLIRKIVWKLRGAAHRLGISRSR